ncbi:MAG TPA: hypothetical protein VKB30_10285 [Candidatus Limnocylindrales bacterium]|nr:hypothetical protein [Candidatus Limnocylindrales bacterium]
MPGLLLPRRRGASRRIAVAVLVAAASVGMSVIPGPVGLIRTAEATDATPLPAWQCTIPSAQDADARPATGLRIALARLLGEHAYLLMESMRAAARNEGEAAAVEASLDANSDTLGKAVSSVYGADAGTAFRALWERHVVAALDYARATAAGDAAGAKSATDELEAFQTAFNEFLAKANPKLDAHAEEAAVQLHLEHVQHFAAGDFAAAYESARRAYGHMFDLGDMLARAIATQYPDRFPDVAVAFSPASELRVYLDRLLGEHLILAAEAMRATIADAPDVAAARQALDANAKDLRDAVASVYGEKAGTAFGEVWTAHLVAYLDYVEAVRTGDQARIDTVRQTLEAYGKVFGDFMANANPKLTSEGVSELISSHTASLVQMVDQYRAENYPAAYATASEAYVHMFDVGDALAGAIAAQFPDRYADVAELPRTDTGPAPDHAPMGAPSRANGWWRAR